MSDLPTTVLDLDGTIVFTETAEIEIPGRSRPTYLAASTASLLATISCRSKLYIATARSAASVAGLVRSLPHVTFAGFVLECGLVWRTDIAEPTRPLAVQQSISQALELRFPDWEQVHGYEQMICCVAPTTTDQPVEMMKEFLRGLGDAGSIWQVHQERHKTFLYPSELCKVSGLRKLGVATVDFAAGDDCRYDHSLLSMALNPMTLCSADEMVVRLVRDRNGFVSAGTNHRGATELMQWLNVKL